MKPLIHPQDNVSLGIVLIVGAVFLLAFADALIKYLSANLSLWQLYVLSSLVAIPILLGLLRKRWPLRETFPVSITWVALRSLLLLMMWITYYAALPLIPLSVAAVAIYTTPIFIAIFAHFGAQERLTIMGWGGIAAGFAGVLIILRPGTEAFVPATLLPVVAAIFYALASLITRHRCQREHPLVLALGLNVGFLLVGIIASVVLVVGELPHAEKYPFLLASWQPISAWMLGIVMLYALLLVAINTGVAKAYQMAPSAVIGTFDYGYLIFACLWGYLLFQETPSLQTFLGMALILIAGWLVFQQHRTGRTG